MASKMQSMAEMGQKNREIRELHPLMKALPNVMWALVCLVLFFYATGWMEYTANKNDWGHTVDTIIATAAICFIFAGVAIMNANYKYLEDRR